MAKTIAPPSPLNASLTAAIKAHGLGQITVICAVALHLQAAHADLLKPDNAKASIPVGYSRQMWLCDGARNPGREDSEVKTFANLATVGLKLARWNKSGIADYAGALAKAEARYAASASADDAEQVSAYGALSDVVDGFTGHVVTLATSLGYKTNRDDLTRLFADKLSGEEQAKIDAAAKRAADKAFKAQEKAAKVEGTTGAPASEPVNTRPVNDGSMPTSEAPPVQPAIAQATPGEVTYIARCTDKGEVIEVEMGGMPDNIRMYLLTAIVEELPAGHCDELATLLAARMAVLTVSAPELKAA